MINKIVILLVLATFCPPCLLFPFPPMDEKKSLSEHETAQDTDEVKELEDLRTSVINNSETNKQETLHDTAEPLPTPLPQSEPNSRRAIFRHRGITEAKKSYWNDKILQSGDGYKIIGKRYYPAEVAMYVYNTGDEEGPAVAVEELVREGVMGRTDAIRYLESIEGFLTFLRGACNKAKTSDSYLKPDLTKKASNPPSEQLISALELDPKGSKAAQVVTTEHPHETVIASTSEPKSPSHSASTTTRPKPAAYKDEMQENELETSYRTNEDMRKIANEKLNNLTLSIGYKFAKELFINTILSGDKIAEETLNNAITSLERGALKNIPPAKREKILEIFSAALVDSLRDYQNSLKMNEVEMFEKSGLYPQQSIPDNQVPMSDVFRKLSLDGRDKIMQFSSKNNRPNSS